MPKNFIYAPIRMLWYSNTLVFHRIIFKSRENAYLGDVEVLWNENSIPHALLFFKYLERFFSVEYLWNAFRHLSKYAEYTSPQLLHRHSTTIPRLFHKTSTISKLPFLLDLRRKVWRSMEKATSTFILRVRRDADMYASVYISTDNTNEPKMNRQLTKRVDLFFCLKNGFLYCFSKFNFSQQVKKYEFRLIISNSQLTIKN